jgi:hypothetical protein
MCVVNPHAMIARGSELHSAKENGSIGAWWKMLKFENCLQNNYLQFNVTPLD